MATLIRYTMSTCHEDTVMSTLCHEDTVALRARPVPEQALAFPVPKQRNSATHFTVLPVASSGGPHRLVDSACL